MKQKTTLIILGCGICLITLTAQNYKGADAVLHTLSKLASSGNGEQSDDAVSSLMSEVKAFRKEANKLAPADAANRWLSLYDAFSKIPQRTLYAVQREGEALSIGALLASLPPSTAWSELATQINKRVQDDPSLSNEALNVLSSVLLGKPDDQYKAIDKILELINNKPSLDHYLKQHLQYGLKSMRLQMIEHSGSDDDQLAIYEEALNAYENDKEENQYHFSAIMVPPLVEIVGKEKAQELLLRHFKTKLPFFVEDKETKRLASEVVLSNLDSIKHAPWSLIEGPEQMVLFESLNQKFPEPDEERQGEKEKAQMIYVLSLIVRDRSDEAVTFLESLAEQQGEGADLSFPYGPLEALEKQGQGKKVLAFLKGMLEKNPAFPVWEQYINLSARLSASKEALAFQKEILAKPGLEDKARKIIGPLLYKALLAADEIEEGVAILQRLIKAGPLKSEATGAADENLEAFQEHLSLCLSLAKIGRLLKREDLLDEGIQTTLQQINQLSATQLGGSLFNNDLILLLEQTNKGELAEEIIQKRLEVLAKSQKQLDGGYLNIGESELTALVWLYHRAGKHQDVLKVLDEFPYWGAPDLIRLSSSSFNRTSLYEMAAEALLKTGNHQAAKKLIHYYVYKFPNSDSGYRLLLELGGEDVMNILDQQIELDPFQERPLIWKAKLQFEAGEQETAESTIRKAISIDPSDGEQGKGNRMRAYAVLADILEKKGDEEQARLMRGAVKAIRLSEDADDWWEAGLLTQAVKRYEDALLHFADAYCIQSRLALRYSELGEFEKAEQHYRRAYELMPDSFGRIESHCFGCEGAFRGERAQNVADQVFSKLAKENPNKAQVFYLLGYLREAQGRFEEAAENYRKAIQLDRDYLNAINRFINLSNVSSEEKEKMMLELLRTDPLQRHSNVNLADIRNLPQFWDIILHTIDKMPTYEPEKELYTLRASGIAMEKQNSQNRRIYRVNTDDSPQYKLRYKFASHTMIQQCGQLLDGMLRHSR